MENTLFIGLKVYSTLKTSKTNVYIECCLKMEKNEIKIKINKNFKFVLYYMVR